MGSPRCTPSDGRTPSGPLQVDPFVTLEGPPALPASAAPAPAAAVAPAVAPTAADAEGDWAARALQEEHKEMT